MAKKMPDDLKALVKRVNKARDFPTNTTPASRHVQMIGEALAKGQQYPMLSEEPQHCAWSLLSTVAGLYEARTAIAALEARVRELEANNALMLSAGVEQERELIVAERRAKQAEAALSVAQKDAERWVWTSQRAWFVDAAAYAFDLRFGPGDFTTEPRNADADDVQRAIDEAIAEDNELDAAIAHGGAGEGERDAS